MFSIFDLLKSEVCGVTNSCQTTGDMT